MTGRTTKEIGLTLGDEEPGKGSLLQRREAEQRSKVEPEQSLENDGKPAWETVSGMLEHEANGDSAVAKATAAAPERRKGEPTAT